MSICYPVLINISCTGLRVELSHGARGTAQALPVAWSAIWVAPSLPEVPWSCLGRYLVLEQTAGF